MKLIFISILILLADQFSKIYVKGFYLPLINLEHSGLANSKSIPIIDKFFYITPVENPGIAFGIDLGPEVKNICFYSYNNRHTWFNSIFIQNTERRFYFEAVYYNYFRWSFRKPN